MLTKRNDELQSKSNETSNVQASADGVKVGCATNVQSNLKRQVRFVDHDLEIAFSIGALEEVASRSVDNNTGYRSI